ncbi:MAG TPA: cytochrome P450 [Streptosporangiaceae bacterium]
MVQAPTYNALDIFDPAHRPNPYPVYRSIRAAGALHPLAPRIYLATRMADCSDVLGDTAWGHGYDDRISPFRPGVGRDDVPGSFLGMDPPDHTRLRRLVSRAFTPRKIAQLRTRIEEIATGLLDSALERNEVDLIEDFADPLPLTVTCEIVGVPVADYPVFRQWSSAIVRGVDPDALLAPDEIAARYTAEAAFESYVKTLVDERRRTHHGDLLSDLAALEDSGDKLSEHELLEIGATLMVAGHETTVNGLGNALVWLHRNPDQLALLRKDPDLVPAAVEEALRYDSPVQYTSRVALEEREVAGRRFERGEGIVLLFGSANRDPDAYDDPDRFDIMRYHGSSPALRHLAFSTGPHHCLGAQLARTVMDVALRSLLDRAPGLTLTTLDAPEYRNLYLFHGPRTLPARMRP